MGSCQLEQGCYVRALAGVLAAILLSGCPHDLNETPPTPLDGTLDLRRYDGPTPDQGPPPDQATSPADQGLPPDNGLPPDEGLPPDTTPCDCAPGNTRPCGRCGTQTCKADCSWGACQGEHGCSPGTTEGCPNNCGSRTCAGDCTFSACSKAGDLSGPSSKLCVSGNHCGDFVPKCVKCWLRCNADGTTYEDGWCATSCEVCTVLDDQC